MLAFLLDVFEAHREEEAIIWHDRVFRYGWLLEHMRECRDLLGEHGVSPGTVVSLEGDFSPNAVALILTLIEHRCVVVPLSRSIGVKRLEFLDIAEVEAFVSLDAEDRATITRREVRAAHPYYERLRREGHAGLVFFSSGSTGKSKAAVHDVTPLLAKFTTPRKQQRAVTFLLFDHMGGVNTMLHIVSCAGCIITVSERTPDGVCAAVDQYRAELLPTSPSFLNLVLLTGAHERHDLSSLQTVTYGTEPMPESTLRRFHELFPRVTLRQTYGLTEVGVLRSKSRSSDSLWVKVGGEGVDTRVVDGILQIKSRSAMLGYLNAPSPFTEDGWLSTGDAVERDGEYLRILGRRSEIINVGGQKVYPAEVESVLLEMENVSEATAYSETNPITGNIVCARVRLTHDEPPKKFTARLKRHCRERLESYKVPVKVVLVDAPQTTARFKKARTPDA